MKHPLPTTALLLASALAAAAPAASFAGTRDLQEHRSIDRGSPPNIGRDERGCVALCSADLSPCDPIQYKAADGRCEDPLDRR